jgi:hypothetical protein
MVELQQGLGGMEESGDMRATSAPNENANAAFAPDQDNPVIPGSPDSSSSNASSSNLTDLDSATELQRPGSGLGNGFEWIY